jgi:hypothetical protein
MPEDPAYAEIRALRERIAHIEKMAAEIPPRPNLEQSLGDIYAPAVAPPPVDRARRDLLNRAHGWAPDPQEEQAIAARAKDPAAYDAAQRAMGANLLAQAYYRDGREASIKLGLYAPEGDPK